MTHLLNNLGTRSMSSLKRCLAVAGYWSMASIVSTLPAASALPAARQPSSGDFNELTDLAKTPQADCERCYYLYAFRLMFPIPNRYVNIGDSARKHGGASFVSAPDQLLARPASEKTRENLLTAAGQIKYCARSTLDADAKKQSQSPPTSVITEGVATITVWDAVTLKSRLTHVYISIGDEGLWIADVNKGFWEAMWASAKQSALQGDTRFGQATQPQ